MAAAVLASCGGAPDGNAPAPAEHDVARSGALAILCENPHGPKVLEPGQPPAWVFAPVEPGEAYRRCLAAGGGGGGNLTYGGGTADGAPGTVGVQTAPAVYLVFWGSQWGSASSPGSNDPSGEATILQNFFGNVGGSAWSNSDTQYCEDVATGSSSCAGVSTAFDAGNGTRLAGVWWDNASAAPSAPRQSQLAGEALRAAAHFGNGVTANSNAQYVIATATRNNSSGFGRQYCAWHSSTSSSSSGIVSYTNLPYITDAGASCGANFNGLGPKAGITIVGGHEFAESVTDPFPASGWLDSAGAENGDKCAWISSGQGAATNVTFGAFAFPVQSLWSNAFNSGGGGCVLAYP